MKVQYWIVLETKHFSELWNVIFMFHLNWAIIFSEFCPLFANVEVPFEKIGETMQNHVTRFDLSTKPRRLLISGMKANKILLISNILEWYMRHGLIVTKIHQVIEYTPMKCFSQFVSEVTAAWREGDADEKKKKKRGKNEVIRELCIWLNHHE